MPTKSSSVEYDEKRLAALRLLIEAGRASVEEIVECAKIAFRSRYSQEQPTDDRNQDLEILRQGLQRFPDEPRLVYELAKHMRLHGDDTKSGRLLRKALRSYRERGDFDWADHIAKELADDCLNDGCAALDAHENTQAERQFRRAILLYPLHADAWGHLGIIYERQGDLLGAGRCYWKALQLGRVACHETELHDRRMVKLIRSAKLKMMPSAKAGMTHYWGQWDTRPYLRAIYNWAQLLYKRKEFKRALAFAQESLFVNPNDNTGARYLAYSVSRALGDKAEMKKLARQYAGESLSHEADQLEITYFGSCIGKQQRRGKPN